MAKSKSFVIVWKDSAPVPGACQYESKESALAALEHHGPENALCVTRGTIVEFGVRVSIIDAAPRRKKSDGPKRTRKPKPEGHKVNEDFFENREA